MRRRQFLGSVGAAGLAGAFVGVGLGRRSRAGGLPPALEAPYQAARKNAKPLLVAIGGAKDQTVIDGLVNKILLGPDHELAVRLLLVDRTSIMDGEHVSVLTGQPVRQDAPSLALVDGQPPRLVAETKLADIEAFLRKQIRLTPAWLEPRVARLSRQNAVLVFAVRNQIAAGQHVGDLGANVPAVVVLEAIKRKGAARAELLAQLFTKHPAIKVPGKHEEMVDCGLGALLVTPIGARFASHFVGNGSHGRRRNHSST